MAVKSNMMDYRLLSLDPRLLECAPDEEKALQHGHNAEINAQLRLSSEFQREARN